MKKLFKHLQFLTLGVFLLSSTAIFAASNQCFSANELNDFKTLYIKLQNELNYEGKDAYLDKKYQVQLKPHSKDKAYPGREFETALFGEYQNSLRKIGKLYQSAKFENDDSFKSNEVLVNFMKAIDDKSSESQDFINKTKIKDVINALEEASQKKYAKSSDKKFMINAGDKYLLEKLLTHAQDRVCSVSKYEETNKGTALFKADYLKQVKNAPLNILVNTIKNAPIEKDSKIDLREPSDLTASLIDQDVAVQSAVADNLNQLSAWVKKVKAQGPKCLASIKSKDFANKIQANIQGCNFGHFIETLSQDNVSNLESVLHFINANEKLLNNSAAKAETSLDELKLEGFISKTFDNLGTAVRCAQLDPANSGDKKVFIRNLPYDEKSNKFDTSGIICKSNSKILGADSCRKQFDLSSDSLGRGLEIKPKKGAAANVTFSVKDSDNCSDISFQDPKAGNLATSPEQCKAQLKDGSAFVWDTKSSKCNEVEIANVSSLEQCVALKKEGSVFNWDAQKKSCGEFSALLTENVLKQSAQQCVAQKKNGYSYKWDSSKNSCDETPTIAGTKLESKISCDAKTAANLPYKWNGNENTCESSPILTAADLKAKVACEAKPAKNGFSNSWDNQARQCGQLEVSKVATLEQCVALKKPGSVFNWDAQKNSCGEFSSLLASAAIKQSVQQTQNGSLVLPEIKSKAACDAIGKNGLLSNWDNSKGQCSAVDLAKVSTIEQCVALKKEGSVFNWDTQKNSCGEFSSLLANPALKQSLQQAQNGSLVLSDVKSKAACDAINKKGLSSSWDNSKGQCSAVDIAKVSTIEQCVALKKEGSVFNWDAQKNSCGEFSSLLSSAALKQAAQQCEVKGSKWNSDKKECDDDKTMTSSSSKEANNGSLVLSDIKSKAACEAINKKGLSSSWDNSKGQCSAADIAKVSTIEQCVALKKEGSVFNWDAQKNSCGEYSSQLSSAALKQAAQQCEIKTKEGSSFKWDAGKNACSEFPVLANANSDTKNTISSAELAKVSSLEQCVALKKPGSVFNWSSEKNSCEESSSLLTEAHLTQTAQQCIAQKKYGYEYKWDSANKSCSAIPTMAGTKLESKIACDAKISAGLPFKWNSSEYSCEKSGNDSDSNSPALSHNGLKNPGLNNYESQTHNGNSKNGDSKNADLQNGNPRSSMLTDSKNGIVTSAKAVTPSIPGDVNEKQARMACESKSSPGNPFRWNSSSKSCEGPTIAANNNNGGKAPIVKPIVLTSEDTKPVVKNPNLPPVGSRGPGTANEELKNKPGTVTEGQKTKPDAITVDPKTEPVTPPVIKAENGNSGTSLSNLPNNSTDKVKAEVTKAQMDCEINKGPTFSWDSVKETCSEAATAVEAKPAEDDASLAAAEKLCIADNADWIEKENEGRPGIKWEWDGKTCVDKRPAKDGGKKVVEEAPAQEEAASAPKRAPARFVPINIPSRQIYLMPGMP
ncbi:hypothetical protein SHI21_20320 [Bacteriovorax sp. PP10]|uniref:Uncharacterized protein n=1 Tax=Bacteriovorax antarcticus TaxID=3088717 RepID=A0ABU5VZV0_9BACT|nr:hypothetical protein [Bacteriovorax sp. PP10]MEA9358594.1 hypothetical protein [Bacteriovorax sp. PP10]